MTESIEYFTGTDEDAVIAVLDRVIKDAFGNELVEDPIYELVPAELKLEEFCDIGDGYKSSGRSPLMAMVSAASVLHTRSKKGKEMLASWTLVSLKFREKPHEMKVLFQGGFINDTTFAFNAVSMGTVLDIKIPRGFVTSYTNGKSVFTRASVADDTEESPNASPFISLFESQARYDQSKINQSLAQIPTLTYLQTKGRISSTTWYSPTPPILVFSPRHGKTIISLRISPYLSNAKSETAKFTMPGEQKPWILEVAVPNPQNFQKARNLLSNISEIPEDLLAAEEVTGELGGGVDTYYALELAREKFRPDSAPFTMTDVVRSGPVVAEVLQELRSRYPQQGMNVYDLLKGIVLKKQ